MGYNHIEIMVLVQIPTVLVFLSLIFCKNSFVSFVYLLVYFL